GLSVRCQTALKCALPGGAAAAVPANRGDASVVRVATVAKMPIRRFIVRLPSVLPYRGAARQRLLNAMLGAVCAARCIAGYSPPVGDASLALRSPQPTSRPS